MPSPKAATGSLRCSSHNSGGSHRSNSMCFMLIKARCVPITSARNVDSSAPSLMTVCGEGLADLRFLHINRYGTTAQASLVCFDEPSQPVHDASPASFVQACQNALNRAITISLLLRLQLQRIDQAVTQALTRCVRFEDFPSVCVGSDLHHQYPVGCSPFVLASTRDPASPSAAKRRKPISAHALSYSAETKGLNGTAFVRATGSFLMRKKN